MCETEYQINPDKDFSRYEGAGKWLGDHGAQPVTERPLVEKQAAIEEIRQCVGLIYRSYILALIRARMEAAKAPVRK